VTTSPWLWHADCRDAGYTLCEAEQQLEQVAKSTTLAGSSELVGKRVCFTGELISTIGGKSVTRAMAHAFAERAGLVIASSVTKQLDVLVVADPCSQSGKAKKARQYGTRIIAEAVFWKMIGVAVD
jgi:NAD-dependent DNA ligase